MDFPRQTHTYAILEVSDDAYHEIAGKLRAAGYDHAFHEDGAIDMHGIALAPQSGEVPSDPAEADEIAKLLIPEVFADIGRLQAEVESLKTLLAAQPVEAGEGIFTINMAGTPTAEQFAYLLHLWNEKWQQPQGQTPPGLFPLVDGVTLDKVDYEGFGLFVIRVPDDMETENAMRIARAWAASWSKTDTPNVPMTVMAQSLRLNRLTEHQMQSMGYMRIPSELTEPG
jgi:hypothetical protein